MLEACRSDLFDPSVVFPKIDFPATRLAFGLLGKELPSRAESTGGQFLRPIGYSGRR